MSEEYALGKNVTAKAAGRSQGSTAVLSVRLGSGELELLEGLCSTTGKNPSQIVREAIRRYAALGGPAQPTVTISTQAMTFSMGRGAQLSGGAGKMIQSEKNVATVA